jgi:hypothetical protein
MNKGSQLVPAEAPFRSLDAKAVKAALTEGHPNPVSLEVGRLMLAYLESFQARTPGNYLRSDDLQMPIQETSFRLASTVFNDRELLAAVTSLLSREGCDRHE